MAILSARGSLMAVRGRYRTQGHPSHMAGALGAGRAYGTGIAIRMGAALQGNPDVPDTRARAEMREEGGQ